MGRGRNRVALAAGCLLAPLAAAAAHVVVADARSVAASAFPGENGLIAFVSDRSGSFDIYVMDPDGGSVTRLTTTAEREDFPVWSPDGTRLAFSAGPFDEQSIFVMNADGSGVTQLTDSPGRDYEPAWSPDGTQILFASDRGRTRAFSQVYVMDADGSDETLLVSAPAAGSAHSPSWSPDGDRIAYAWTESGTIGDTMFVAAPDGSDATVVLEMPDGLGELDWSPDGSRIVFLGRTDGGSSIDLYVVEVAGGVVTQLTDGARGITPRWSPDGQLITFTRSSESGLVDDVWVMNADGSGQVQLTPTGDEFTEWQPTWQPAPPTYDLTVTPDSAQREVGDDHTVRFALVEDDTGEPGVGRDLSVQVTGPHPQTATVTTGSDGRASFSWVSSEPGTDTVIACAEVDGSAGCGAEEPLATATVLWGAIGPVDDPRLAFTDDSDALYAVTVQREVDEGGGESYLLDGQPTSFATDLSAYEAGPKHEGETGGTPGTAPAFVSTRHDPDGDVYVAAAGDATRITCDAGIETHPVRGPDGSIAYASNADGDWDIYVISPPGPVISRPPPGWAYRAGSVANAGAATAAGLAPGDCEPGWTTTKITDDEPAGTDDLWPTWTPDGGLVFSRSAAGELSDLYSVGIDDFEWQEPDQLTTTAEIAESQPAATEFAIEVDETCDPDGGCTPIYEYQTWVAFTTTEDQRDGTVALLSPADPEEVVGLGLDGQASEPAWSSALDPTHLAFTSTDEDPYGEIQIARVEPPIVEEEGFSDPQVVGAASLSNGLSGIGESHPFWLEEFGTGEFDVGATLVYTSRSSEDVAEDSRNLAADISDVLVVDGSQRRVIRRQRELAGGEVVHRYDEAGPSYSPDGGRIVYSRSAYPETEIAGSRMLMVANADGSDPALLLPASQRLGSDLDVDPAWSPDGTKIAFVRIRGAGGGDPDPDPPEIWIYDLATEVATRIPGSTVEGAGADLSPSWAPDSEHLVIARTQGDGGAPNDGARRWGSYRVGSNPELHILDATDPTAPALGLDSCNDGCAVRGRTPAWSPDGSRIVYEADGQLQLVTLPDPCCTGPEVDVDGPVAVTGFDSFDGTGPTPSRSVVSAAHDPAWSPDGSEIAFAGQPAGQPDQRDIWGIAPDGSGLRPITDERGPETEPTYQPDRTADVAVTVSVANSPALIGTPVVATFTVTNNGPAPAASVALDTAFTTGASTNAPGAPPDCRADGSGCGFVLLAAGESRVYQVRVRHPAPVLGTATGTVLADNPDPVGSNNTASAPYRVHGPDVQVRVRLDEKVGYVGGLRVAKVTVRNVGTDPVEDVSLTATWPAEVVAGVVPPLPSATPDCLPAGDACDLGTIGVGARRSFRVALETLVEGAAPITAEVGTTTAEVTTENNEHTVDLEILQPTVRVLPAVSPPGKVVLVYGESMPPASDVSLEWASGINIHTGPFEVSEDGTIRVPLLIVRHDLLGVRPLTATSTDDLFTPVEGELLVVPRTLMPPNFNGRG